MYAVVRQYARAEDLADAMERQSDEVEALVTGVSGFVAYYAVRAGDSLTSITVCQDRAGTLDSTRRAAEWVRLNSLATAGMTLDVTDGEVILSFQ
ncbi:MAG: hypothetical protein H0W06_08140 [Chloroflexia bacterium]|nr:hypothetical protein [Chloroflexia bacterium]